MMDIRQYRYEIRRDGVHFLPVASEKFFTGNRLCWRVVYEAWDGQQIIREYVTGRVMRNGELVIEGVRDGKSAY